MENTDSTVPVVVPISTGTMTYQPLEFTEEQKTLIKRMCQAEGLDDNEFQVFLHICKRRRLDPILRQIYATKRNKKIKDGNADKWIKILVPIVAIEGMTAIADRTGTYAPSEKKPEYEFAKPGDKLPISCTVWVKKLRQGIWHEFPFTAFFSEFVQDTDLWRKMPAHMLFKCARAGALRMGWPEDCGGLYVEEEWAETGSYEEAPAKKEREKASLKTLKPSKQANRGHGKEGIKEAMNVEGQPEQKKSEISDLIPKAEAVISEFHEAASFVGDDRIKREKRDVSLLELSILLNTMWPLDKEESRPLRNKIGHELFKLQAKEELRDLAYPQDTIDAALIALRKYRDLEDKPTSDLGIHNQIVAFFIEAKQELELKAADAQKGLF